jgi:YbgC/YbaW family acyl-CoA thioester hydrolase
MGHESEVSIAVAWGEMDAYGHVNNAVFLRWFETARVEWLEQVKFTEEGRLGPVLKTAAIEFLAPVTHPDTVRVRVRPDEPGNTSVKLTYEVWSERLGKVAATGETVVVLVDQEAGQSVRIPDDVRRRIAPPAPAAARAPARRARGIDVDELAPVQAGGRVTPAQLDAYLGKHIKLICGNQNASDKSNHCAHFANHVLGLDFGWSCRKAKGGKAPAANLRVHETFLRCGAVGLWPPPPGITQCYAFVTKKANVNLKKKQMVNVPKKHIGIFHTDHIWHYSNRQRKVVKQRPEDFAKHYPGPGFAVFYGEFPPPP